MPSKYTINVALHGHHYFRVESDLWDLERAVAVFNDLCNRFRVAEGFKITLTHWTSTGHQVAETVA